MYNEMVILKLVQSMTKMIASPSSVFREQILSHFREKGEGMYERIKNYMEMSDSVTSVNDDDEKDKTTTTESIVKIKVNDNDQKCLLVPPEFPLIPASRGFCLTLVGVLENFYKKLQAITE